MVGHVSDRCALGEQPIAGQQANLLTKKPETETVTDVTTASPV